MTSGWRGRGRSTSIISLISPGLAFSATIRSASKIASSISWVTKIMVMSMFCQRSIKWRCIFCRVCGSSAPNGSSISRIFGSLTKARAIATRCFIPPDSSCGYWFSYFSRPIILIHSRACASAAALLWPFMRGPNMTFSLTVFHGNRV